MNLRRAKSDLLIVNPSITGAYQMSALTREELIKKAANVGIVLSDECLDIIMGFNPVLVTLASLENELFSAALIDLTHQISTLLEKERK